ncbi:Cell wall-associated hydrolase, NlpC family [Gillisia sp. Hel1_33_143]|uniref:C40 family peptidase n=1 Tax=unclassified Gillisia TaxID=2615025 RepID=UPI000552B3F1|nr:MULTISPECIES: C40 family peptidase [unclassified Gillisia]SDS02152.1 Cell wall-associated hydrolase, NlpC family [Gillisia sp. Hel1_33_143]
MRSRILTLSVLLIFSLFLTSCGASKSQIPQTKEARKLAKKVKFNPPAPAVAIKTAKPEELPEDNRVYNITSHALDYQGTKYKFGGTTSDGMDCSGLVYTSFLKEDIPLPRTSRAMSLQGERLSLDDVNIGDLLFFETNKNKKVVNHVGLVVEIQPGQILFIHSTTSLGVIISSLSENYWFDHFVMARRVI